MGKAVVKHIAAEVTEKYIGWMFAHAVEAAAASVEAMDLGSHVAGVTVDAATGGLTGAANRTVQANPTGLGTPQKNRISDWEAIKLFFTDFLLQRLQSIFWHTIPSSRFMASPRA